jgi:ABC-type lipoprotein export system ATPase subunit
MIQLSNIHKSYIVGNTTFPVLNDISLSIAEGDFLAIV